MGPSDKLIQMDPLFQDVFRCLAHQNKPPAVRSLVKALDIRLSRCVSTCFMISKLSGAAASCPEVNDLILLVFYSEQLLPRTIAAA